LTWIVTTARQSILERFTLKGISKAGSIDNSIFFYQSVIVRHVVLSSCHGDLFAFEKNNVLTCMLMSMITMMAAKFFAPNCINARALAYSIFIPYAR
jgi:hypothetical protein